VAGAAGRLKSAAIEPAQANNAFKLTSAGGWSPSGTTRLLRSQLNAMFDGLQERE
jgi:hypothetical protein